uniref:Coagulation factor n=1 Tax=Rhipicephalus appendiculatus TaxID=34631 RepID=A0A131YP18_RHIAP
MGPEFGVKLLSCSLYGFFKKFAAVTVAVALLQLSLVRCELNLAQSWSEKCQAATKEGHTPGLCVPAAWCPSLDSAVRRDDLPSPCSVHDGLPLECCPTDKVVKPAPPNVGCGAVVNDPGSLLDRQVKEGVTPASSPWPWMAAIFKGDKFICGGSLLDADTVLTAAQCFYDVKGDNDIGKYKVRLGILDLNETAKTANSHVANLSVLRIRPHEDYRARRFYNDIALVKTATKVAYSSHISPVCLPQPYFELSGPVTVLGWGQSVFGGELSSRLQERHASVISNKECEEIFRQVPSFLTTATEGIAQSIVCAHNETGVDSCQGDSGGPMLARGPDSRWYVVGLVSFGIGCGGRYPGGYTRVTAFLDWIARNRH